MRDLNCTEFEARLMQAVEDRESLDSCESETDPQSSPWQELRAQANRCPHCRTLWNEFALLERVLPAWKSQLPPVDLADRVLARWREEQSAQDPPMSPSKAKGQKKASWRFPWTLVMAVAATVLISIPFVFPPSNSEFPNGTTEVSHISPEPEQARVGTSVSGTDAVEETEQVADWQTMAQEASSAYWALASNTADSFASVTVFVPPRKTVTNEQIPETPSSSGGWVEGLGSGLKPISQDVKKSMNFLLEALPRDPSTI